MLKQTFIHLPGVARRTEAYFWRRGLATWEDFLAAPRVPGFSQPRLESLKAGLLDSLEHLDDPTYFTRLLPHQEHWRLYRWFRPRAVFLDIETYGVTWPHLLVTVVGLSDGVNLRQFLQGRDLEKLPEVLSAYDIVITYNGSQFDLPVLKAYFPQLKIPPVHLDLRFILARLGFRGGLKKIESLVGLQRPPDVEGLNGYHAVLLWQRYQRGDVSSLELLLKYNQQDVMNLKVLMERAFDLNKERLLNWEGRG